MVIIAAGGGFVNRFSKKKGRKITGGWSERTGGAFQAPREERCCLCQGELYPGDPYFELDGRAVCTDCLGRYARRYFAPQLRRVGGSRNNL